MKAIDNYDLLNKYTFLKSLDQFLGKLEPQIRFTKDEKKQFNGFRDKLMLIANEFSPD